MSNINFGPFTVDQSNSDDELMFINVLGGSSIAIHRTHEGLIVDIFSASGESVATCAAEYHQLHDLEPQEDGK
jgi:hypothetical protein